MVQIKVHKFCKSNPVYCSNHKFKYQFINSIYKYYYKHFCEQHNLRYMAPAMNISSEELNTFAENKLL